MIWLNFRKCWKKYRVSRKNNFSSKRSVWRVECFFDNPDKNLTKTEARKLSLHVREGWNLFFQKKEFGKAAEFFWWMFENGEKDIFFEKNAFQRNFLRTRRKLFRLFNSSRKKFAESRNLIYEKVKLTTRIFSLSFFYGHEEGFFDNTWRVSLNFWKKTNVLKQLVSSKCSSGTLDWSFGDNV